MEDKYYYVAKVILELGFSKSNIKFTKGEEAEFVHLLNEFKKIEYQNEDKLNKIFEVIECYCDDGFEWEKVFEYLNLEIISNYNLCLFMSTILPSVHYDTFIEKVNKCNDIVLVCYYYHMYIEANHLPIGEVLENYEEYIQSYFSRINKSYREVLLDIAKQPSFSLFDEVNNHNGIYLDKYRAYTMHSLINRTTIDIDLINTIMHNIKIFDELTRNNLIRHILNKSTDMYFDFSIEDNRNKTDRIELSLYAKDVKGAIETIQNSDFRLYDIEQLNTLINNSCYKNNDVYPFIDRLKYILNVFLSNKKDNLNGGFRKNDIDYFIYSDKIEIISLDSIKIIKELLSKEDFNKFMLNKVIENNIPVYWGDDVLYTLEYFDTKLARRVPAKDYMEYEEVIKLLQRDNYLSRTR